MALISKMEEKNTATRAVATTISGSVNPARARFSLPSNISNYENYHSASGFGYNFFTLFQYTAGRKVSPQRQSRISDLTICYIGACVCAAVASPVIRRCCITPLRRVKNSCLARNRSGLTNLELSGSPGGAGRVPCRQHRSRQSSRRDVLLRLIPNSIPPYSLNATRRPTHSPRRR